MADKLAYGQARPDYARFPKYPILIEALKVFLIFAAPISVIAYAAYDMVEGYTYMYYAAGFVLMPWVSTFIRRKIGNLFVFLGVQVLFMGWIVLAPHIILTTLGIIFLISLTVYGAVRMLSNEEEKEASTLLFIFSMVAMICVYVLAVSRERTGYEWMLVAQAFLYAILFMYYEHWIGVHDALRNVDKDGNFSTRHIIRFNSKMLGGYLGITLLTFGVLYFLGLGDLISMGSKWLLIMIRRIIRYFANIEPTEEAYQQEEAMLEDDRTFGDFFGEMKTGTFWLVLEKVLTIALVIFLIGIVVFVIYYLIKRFSKTYRYEEQGYEETKAFYHEVPPSKKRRRSLREIFDNSPENRIRKAYYKKVKGHMGKKVQVYDTPTEVGDMLPDVKGLVEEYDEARYAKKSL